jgi:hypothetical protein
LLLGALLPLLLLLLVPFVLAACFAASFRCCFSSFSMISRYCNRQCN